MTGPIIGVMKGALAGLIATAPMTAYLMGGPSLDAIGTPPPERIVDTLLPRETDRTRRFWAAMVHLSIGAGSGAVYGVVHRGHGPLSGAAFGLVIWAVGYEAVLPLLGVLPPAHRDSAGRRRALIQAHLVFGAILGLLAR